MTYDALGRLVATRDYLGNTTSMGYCAELAQEPCTVVDPFGNTSSIQEDELGREIARTDPLGHTTSTSYDLLGRRATVTDAANKITTFGYDAVGRLRTVLDALNGLTQYGYDPRGNRTSVTDSNNHTTSFGYDRANRLTSETTPVNTSTQYGYDPAGNRTSKLDGKGQLTQFRYDPDRRLTDIIYADGSTAHFDYDARGNKILEQNVDITRHLTYDDVGRVATVEDATAGHTLSYTYDAAGNRATMQLSPDGETTQYRWDARGLLSRLIDPEGGVYQFGYDNAGRRMNATYPNGMTLTQAYDDASRVLSMVYSNRSGAVLQSFTYEYDSRGNRLSKGFADGTAETYGYDDLSRLTSAAYPGGKSVTYEYDGVGNRKKMIELGVPGAGTTTYQYSDFNQLLSLVGPQGETTFQYDPNGNQTLWIAPSGTTTYTWDARDRLRQVSNAIGPSRFGYDSDGLRVEIQDLQGSRRVLLDGIEEIAEYDASTHTQRARFDHDPSRVDGLLAQVTTQGSTFFISDALGSIYGLVDLAGNAIASYAYDAFGARTAQYEQVPTNWGFTGRRHETDDSGNLYLRARVYSVSLGRFVSLDPLGMPNGPNRYQYAGASPTNFKDPTGLIFSKYVDKATCQTGHLNASWVEIGLLTALLAVLTDLSWSGFEYYYPIVAGEPLSEPPRFFSFSESETVSALLAAPVRVECACMSTKELGGANAGTEDPIPPDIEYNVYLSDDVVRSGIYPSGLDPGIASALLHEFVHIGVDNGSPKIKNLGIAVQTTTTGQRPFGLTGSFNNGYYSDYLSESAARAAEVIAFGHNPLNFYLGAY
jgi:RHS repeat-associated protein